jgi:hypothetical protein
MSAPLILGTNSIKDVGYNVDNSLRFNDGSSDALIRTLADPGGAGNRNKWTFSTWIKRGQLGQNKWIFGSYQSSAYYTSINFESNDTLNFFDYYNSSVNGQRQTNRVFRDPNAWYHLVFIWDKDNATSDHKMRIYVNGVEETSFAASSAPSNATTLNADGQDISIGQKEGQGNYFDGYMCETVFNDGQAYTADNYGEFDSDTGIWKPINIEDQSLTYGTNGFYLDYKNSSSLGNDVSGNDNDFTVNNLTSIDQTTDTCTNNYCTLNGVFVSQASSFSTSPLKEGNLVNTNNGSNTNYIAESNMPMSAGTWYAEFKVGADVSGGIAVGIRDADKSHTASAGTGTVTYKNNGKKQIDGTNSDYGATYTTGDIIGFLYNATSGTLTAYKNGTSQGTLYSSGSGKSWIFFVVRSNTSTNYSDQWNFGNPTFTISSSNTDPEGYGNFEYSTNNGYALNTKNLAEYG